MLADLITKILKICPRGTSVLDVGAGLEAPYQIGLAHRARRLELLDAHEPYLIANRTGGPNVHKVRGEVPDKLGDYEDAEFDVVLAIDVIEHLDLASAYIVIEELQRIGRVVGIFTPDGPSPQDHDAYMMGADHWQTHRSEWTAQMLEARGFNVERMVDFHGTGRHALWVTWRMP